MFLPVNHPRVFLKQGRKKETRILVVCAGDSITHGMASANYVDKLRLKFSGEGYEFVNAGINGNLAWNLLRRLDEIIACQPDVVTVLIGTNDVNATFSPEWEENYRKEQGITEKPTLAWYRSNLARIVERLKSETHARIAVLDLPMVGEDLKSAMNLKVEQYNAVIQAVTAEKGVTYLPLHQRLALLLPAHHTPPPYEGSKEVMLQAMLKHHVLRKSWDQVSVEQGLTLLTDHIHLNDRAARVIAELVGSFLTG